MRHKDMVGKKVFAVHWSEDGVCESCMRTITFACEAYYELDAYDIADGNVDSHMDTSFFVYDGKWNPHNPPFELIAKGLRNTSSTFTTETYDWFKMALKEQHMTFAIKHHQIVGVRPINNAHLKSEYAKVKARDKNGHFVAMTPLDDRRRKDRERQAIARQKHKTDMIDRIRSHRENGMTWSDIELDCNNTYRERKNAIGWEKWYHYNTKGATT